MPHRNIGPSGSVEHLCVQECVYDYLQVYKAKLDGSEEVAVKFFNPAEISGSLSSHRRRFEEEIQIMRMCQHPNIVGFLGCWVMSVRRLSRSSLPPCGSLYAPRHTS